MMVFRDENDVEHRYVGPHRTGWSEAGQELVSAKCVCRWRTDEVTPEVALEEFQDHLEEVLGGPLD